MEPFRVYIPLTQLLGHCRIRENLNPLLGNPSPSADAFRSGPNRASPSSPFLQTVAFSDFFEPTLRRFDGIFAFIDADKSPVH